MKSANYVDLIVVVCYFLFMLGIGFYFMRVNKGGKQYFTGGSMIPWWMSGMTMYMANFSAWTFTGAAGFAYSTGWFALFYFGAGPVAYFIGTQMTAVKWRRTRSISPVEYTYSRYTVSTQQFISWVVSTNFVLSAGVQLASTCKLLAPVMGVDITLTVLLTGVIILLYTFLGGVWAVSVTDVVQGVILLSITFVVLPLSLSLIGGFGKLAATLPPLSFDHTYNTTHYTQHWLIAILVISTIGFAGGQGQRFYSVKNEKDALRVGRFAAVLALTIPIVFGIPPLVAKVYWPDLTQVEWFRPYFGKNPQDLVFIALCLKLLPNGLIGVFVAAMLAATMSTLSVVYNMVSSIFSRDIYQGIFKKTLDDRTLLRTGRIAAATIGLIVMGLAVFFVSSEWGIFNWMQTFFTLLNIPVTVPLAFGLLNRRVPKWSAVGAISWGLITGMTTRLLLGWDIGPQVYLAFAMTLGIFVTSRFTGRLYRENKPALGALSAAVAAGASVLFLLTAPADFAAWQKLLALASAAALGGSLYAFARLFAYETDEERSRIAAFFRKIDIPVDVAKEVYSEGKKQIRTMPLVGGTTIVMGLLVSLVLLTDLSASERLTIGIIIGIMIVFGVLMWAGGVRSARKFAEGSGDPRQ
jgi:SSS family solute:Na+ symporter